MEEIDIHAKLAQIETAPHFSMIFDGDTEKAEMIAEHLMWLHSIRRERPLVSRPYKVGIYIRYFNQTRYNNYLDFHKKGFIDTIGLCPKWELVDFYIDEGSTAPNMENAPEWCRLLQDCMEGKVDLIITQKISNVRRSLMRSQFSPECLLRFQSRLASISSPRTFLPLRPTTART